MHVLAVVGARPQFVKAAEFAAAWDQPGSTLDILHTGQHYDHALSRTFFDELRIADPIANLDVGSGSHAYQTGEIIRRFDVFLESLNDLPSWIVVFGDTNSTVAAALVAAKRHIPVAHVEAGLRSGDNRMPEEINRILSDRLSTLLFCPTQQACDNLAAEGVTTGVHLTGDVMFDSVMRHKDHAVEKFASSGRTLPFMLATIHRAENTDNADRLRGILRCLGSSPGSILWPMHPRTEKLLAHFRLDLPDNVERMGPVGYLEMLGMIQAADRVITDSGGVQKEAFWLHTPCITMRSTTEWPETTAGGWNVLVDVDPDRFRAAVKEVPTAPPHSSPHGQAAKKMIELIVRAESERGGIVPSR